MAMYSIKAMHSIKATQWLMAVPVYPRTVRTADWGLRRYAFRIGGGR